MSEENKAIVRRFLDELWNKQNPAILNQLATPNYTLTSSGDAFRSAFTDIKLTVNDQVAESDKVVTRWTMTGTHTGEFEGVASTGKQVTSTGIFIHRIEGGKLAERWAAVSVLGQQQQMVAVLTSP